MNPASGPSPQPDTPHDPYVALGIRNFRLFLGGSLLANAGAQMQAVAVGWEIYNRTGNAYALGLVGLVQVVPVVLLALAAGHAADRFPRQRIVVASMIFSAAASVVMAFVSLSEAPIGAMYACLLVNATARAFHHPAKSSLLPQLVPRAVFSNAVTWGMTGFQLSSVIGPAIGGLLLRFTSPAVVYLLAASGSLLYAVAMASLRDVAVAAGTRTAATIESLVAGFVFVWNHPVILAALALDLFAVLLGGATTLLPVYAKDILHVGPTGLGWLEAAPALGALALAVTLAHLPPLRHAGRALLLAVTGFGLATIVFGLSQWFWLSFLMFFLTGACDNISVVVRHTLVQMLTPDAMRGRVSAVNSMFIGTSNELGGMESGFVAGWVSPLFSVVAGGVGTLIVVLIVALKCPQLRRYGRLDKIVQETGPDVAPRQSDRPGDTPLVALLPEAGARPAETAP